MSKSKWYTVRVSPIDEVREPYKFKIETSNLRSTMEKYTRDKEGETTSTWKVIR